jgi:hypothetical protein
MYIDPGSGSLILQVLAAGVLSAGALLYRVRDRLARMLRSVLRRPPQQ